MNTSILIIGDEGRLRDGLQTILLALGGIKEVKSVNDFESASPLISKEFPSLIILDGSEKTKNYCATLKKMCDPDRIKPCIVIASTLNEWRLAWENQADSVLMQGFSTTELQTELIRLGIINPSKPKKSAQNQGIKFNQDQQTQKTLPS